MQLVNSPVFGQECSSDEVDFRWHTGVDMAKLKRYGPLRLTQIKTRGSVSYGISGIQLIFEHGIESPIVDASRPAAE